MWLPDQHLASPLHRKLAPTLLRAVRAVAPENALVLRPFREASISIGRHRPRHLFAVFTQVFGVVAQDIFRVRSRSFSGSGFDLRGQLQPQHR
jgi:hypothetical protein